MKELKIFSVSDEYIAYLRKEIPNVYSNKIENRTHTRKYVGVVIELAGYKYYIPMSSPKDTDYQIAGKNLVIKNTAGEKELKGTLRISHMIPVPETELELYDLDNEPDAEYKDLVQNEVIFIRKNKPRLFTTLL